MSVNGALVEAKMCTFTREPTHFVFNKCPIYTYNGANAKFSTNSHETDYSVVVSGSYQIISLCAESIQLMDTKRRVGCVGVCWGDRESVDV